MSTRVLGAAAAAAALWICLGALPAIANLVQPGQLQTDVEPYAPPTGLLLAQRGEPVLFYSYEAPPFSDFQFENGLEFGRTAHFGQSVVRDPGTGQLTFVYHVSGPESGSLASTLTIWFGLEFDRVQCDVHATLTSGQGASASPALFSVARDVSGFKLEFTESPGVQRSAGVAWDIAIATNARAFDTAGLLFSTASDNVTVWDTNLTGPIGTHVIAATLSGPLSGGGVDGLFIPREGSPAAIPLPPAQCVGVAGLTLALAIARTMRSL